MLIFPVVSLIAAAYLAAQLLQAEGKMPTSVYHGEPVYSLKNLGRNRPFSSHIMHSYRELSISVDDLLTLSNAAKEVVEDRKGKKAEKIRSYVKTQFHEKGFTLRVNKLKSLSELVRVINRSMNDRKSNPEIILGVSAFGENMVPVKDRKKAVVQLERCDFVVSPLKKAAGATYDSCSSVNQYSGMDRVTVGPLVGCVPSEHNHFSFIHIEDNVMWKYDYDSGDSPVGVTGHKITHLVEDDFLQIYRGG